jgi:hypothetical protein
VLLAGVLAVVACAAAALPAAWVRGQRPAPRRVLPAFGRSVWLLGLSELLDAAGPSVVYLVLALSGRTTDSGPLYLALMVAAVVGSFVLYQLKLHQPATSTRLRGAGGAAGRAQATRLLRVAERAGLVFAVVTTACLLLPGGRSLLLDATGAWFYLLVLALLAVEMVVSSLVLYAAFLLENTNSRVLTLTSSAALLGFVATGLIAAVAVPVLGAVGGVAALVLAVAVKAFTLRRLLRRQQPQTATSTVPSIPKRATTP